MPASLKIKDKDAQLELAKEYFEQIYKRDINSVDNTKRNPELMKAILKSYSRNISTVSKLSTITDDIKNSFITTTETVSNYIEVLESLI